MKKLVLGLMIMSAAAFASHSQSKYRTYTNDRFYFSIEYPSDLLRMQPPPENNDGRTFRSNDGKIEMRAWGQFNALGRTFYAEYEASLEKCGTAKTYKDFRERYFVISCSMGSRIYYQRTMHRGDVGPEVFFTFTIEYPKSQKAKLDSVVTRVSRSFRFDPDAEI